MFNSPSIISYLSLNKRNDELLVPKWMMNMKHYNRGSVWRLMDLGNAFFIIFSVAKFYLKPSHSATHLWKLIELLYVRWANFHILHYLF